jgi:hypothetical protein
VVSLSHAQTAAAPPEPSGKSAPSGFTSVISDYQPYREQAVGDWKKANDEVGRIGGWRAYTREANEPSPSAPQGILPAPRAAPAPKDPHAGHAKP